MIVIGLSHRDTPLEVREKLALGGDALERVLQKLVKLDGVGEAVVLSTCNRVEVYAHALDDTNPTPTIRAMMDVLGGVGGRKVAPHLNARHGTRALKHLYRVACSLDSLVVGEPQILGQLKDALRLARDTGCVGPHLEHAMRGAFHAAKRVRTETEIGAGKVSVPTVAVDLTKQIFEDLRGHKALLVGAGEMAETAAKLLARAGAPIMVCNRSTGRAERLARAVAGRALAWNDLERGLVEADIVITSTGSTRPVITRKQVRALRRERRGRSLFLIDIAVPRDVEPSVNDLDNVYLYDIDDLSHAVADYLESRASEAKKAEAIVQFELAAFARKRSERLLAPVIVAMRNRTREALEHEMRKSLKGKLKHLDEHDREALTTMLEASVKRLMHAPTKKLKSLAGRPVAFDHAHTLSELFDLDEAIRAQIEEARASDPPDSDEGVEPDTGKPPEATLR